MEVQPGTKATGSLSVVGRDVPGSSSASGWKGWIPGRDEEGPLLECLSTDATCPGDDFCPEQGHLCREGAAQQQPSSRVVAGAGCVLGIVRHMQSV